MRFKGLDLNLLLALHVLLDEASVSRAAGRLFISQPAASAALARLRDWFGDPLLVAHGKRLVLSPYALRLKPMLVQVLAEIDTLISQPVHFDPATVQRRFRVCTSDYLTSVVLRPLLSVISLLAPRIELDIVPPDDKAVEALDRGELDLLMIPHEFVSPTHPARLLLEEQHVVAGWSGNPLLDRPLTLEGFIGAGHVTVRLGRMTRMTYAEAQLRLLGISRREEVVVPSFTLVPDLLVGTHRLAIMHERLARQAALKTDIRLVPMPFDIPPMREMVQYHRARKDDAGLIWLLGQIDAVIAADSLMAG